MWEIMTMVTIRSSSTKTIVSSSSSGLDLTRIKEGSFWSSRRSRRRCSHRAVQTLSAFLILVFLLSPLNLLYSLRRLALISDIILFQPLHHSSPREIRYSRVVSLLDPSFLGGNDFSGTWEKPNPTTNTTMKNHTSSLLLGRVIDVRPMSSLRRQNVLQDSDYYNDERKDSFETEDCVAQHAWQHAMYPTCSLFHERDLTSFFRQGRKGIEPNERSSNNNNNSTDEAVRIVAKGGWRDVWVLLQEGELKPSHVLKTLRWKHDTTEPNLDTNRKDALTMERLTSSKYIMNIFGYCGTSSLVEFADGPDISQTMWPDGAEKGGDIDREQYEASSKLHTKLELLHIAVQATMGLAAFHNIDKEGYPSIAHNDISPTQWVKIGNTYKLNDFNRGRMLAWNPNTQEICPYYERYNPGKRRSPEEYIHKAPLSAAVDVYSLGNIFYVLLMKQWPFKYYKEKKIAHAINHGERPFMFPHVQNSTDPIDRTLLEAMEMCFHQNPADRATARQVETFLKDKLRESDPGRLETWGES